MPDASCSLEQAARRRHETLGLDQAPGIVWVGLGLLHEDRLLYCRDWIRAFICAESAASGASAT